MLELTNSTGIIVTKTWIDESVLDAEMQVQNFDIFRSDRKGWRCGGASAFLSFELLCKKKAAFSNGVVETLVIKYKKLNTLFVSVYHPPDTSISEWSEAMCDLQHVIDISQSNGGYGTIVMASYFNFPKVKSTS